VVLQHCVSPSILRLQSQEFVACFSSDETKLTKLGAVLVPDFQGPLTLCKVAFDVLYRLPFRLRLGCSFLSSLHWHWCTSFAINGKSQVLRDLVSLGSFPEHGFQYPETDFFHFLVCTFYTSRTSSLKWQPHFQTRSEQVVCSNNHGTKSSQQYPPARKRKSQCGQRSKLLRSRRRFE
jgi:hypothetical protein